MSIRVDQYTRDGELVATHKSMNQAIRYLLNTPTLSNDRAKKHSPDIWKAVNGYRKTAYGFVWRFAGEEFLGVV